MTRLIFLLFFVISCQIALAYETESGIKDDNIDTINSQSEFEALLKKASGRQEIKAFINPGSYTVPDAQPIYRTFHLKGNGAVIKQKNKIVAKSDATGETPTHYICPIDGIGIFNLFVDKTGKIIPVSEEVDSAMKVNLVTEDIICIYEADDSLIKKIKVRIPDNLDQLKNRKFDRAFGYIDSWWTAPAFAVTHSDSEYLYCELLIQERKKEQYNAWINGERFQYKQNPGFVIYNIEPQSDRIYYTAKSIYIPNKYDTIEIIDYYSKPLFLLQEDADIVFEGLDIINSNSVFYGQEKFTGVLYINKCNFCNILKQVVGTYYESSIEKINIDNCKFTNCAFIDWVPLIKIQAPACIGKIKNNVFNQYADGFCSYKNVVQYIYIRFCKEFEISDNKFLNNPRGGLFLLNGKIDVVSNEFYNDSIFNSYPYRNFSRDAGAIYCNRLFGDTRIKEDNPNKINLRLNKIHDFLGKGDVRGIFIDDGRGDVTCYGNLIFHGQSKSIDSRAVRHDPYSSIRNRLEYNILEYPYRFNYGDSVFGKDRPVLHDNILLFNDRENITTVPNTTDISTLDFEIDGYDVMIDSDIWETLPDDVRNLINPIKRKD